MGGSSFIEIVNGTDIKTVFSGLKDRADRDYGTRSYNGAINTCSLDYRASRIYSKYSEKNMKEAMKYIDDHDNGEKWLAKYIDLGVVEYQVRTIKKVHKEADADYKMRFCVCHYGSNNDIKVVEHKETKKLADDTAMKYVMKGIPVWVEKRYILLKGQPVTTRFTVETKVYKTEPKLKPMDNRRVVAIHKYVLYGWASS